MRNRITIILYHSVRSTRDPFRSGVMDAITFREQVRMLRKIFNLMTLGDVLAHWRQGERLPLRTACITFDDGYKDNLEIASPILEAFDVQATFFISTAFLQGGCMWNDEIINCVAGYAGCTLDLREFGLEKVPSATTQHKRNIIRTLIRHLKSACTKQRSRGIAMLRAMTDCHADPTLMLSPSEVQELHERGMEIGAHTVNHPLLTTIPADSARTEIADSRAELGDLIGEPVNLFAYPNGTPHLDYSTDHVEMVRELGFDAAVTTSSGMARLDGDLFQLARVQPGRRTGWPFAGRLIKDGLLMRPEYV